MAEAKLEPDTPTCPPISDFEMDMMRMEQMALLLEEEGEASLNLFSQTSNDSNPRQPYWNEPRYDRSAVPSILVSGITSDDKSEISGEVSLAMSKVQMNEAAEGHSGPLAETTPAGGAIPKSEFRRSVSVESSGGR